MERPPIVEKVDVEVAASAAGGVQRLDAQRRERRAVGWSAWMDKSHKTNNCLFAKLCTAEGKFGATM